MGAPQYIQWQSIVVRQLECSFQILMKIAVQEANLYRLDNVDKHWIISPQDVRQIADEAQTQEKAED